MPGSHIRRSPVYNAGRGRVRDWVEFTAIRAIPWWTRSIGVEGRIPFSERQLCPACPRNLQVYRVRVLMCGASVGRKSYQRPPDPERPIQCRPCQAPTPAAAAHDDPAKTWIRLAFWRQAVQPGAPSRTELTSRFTRNPMSDQCRTSLRRASSDLLCFVGQCSVK